MTRKQEACRHSADRRSGPKDAKTFRAIIEHVVDKGRQHGYCPPEQHGEHVKRLRSEHDLVSEDKTQPLPDTAKNAKSAATR